MNLQKLVLHLVNEVHIPKKRIAELLEVDPKKVTNMTKADEYMVLNVPTHTKAIRAGV